MIINKNKSYGGYSYQCKCDICNKLFYRKAAHVERTNHQFCNQVCASIYKSLEISGNGNPCYGLLGEKHPAYGYKFSSESLKIKSNNFKGNKNPMWKGGKSSDNGYIIIYKPDHPYNNGGYMLEHRLIMEEYIKRYLTLEEVVHHINGIRDDNRIENLILFDNNSEHIKWHFLFRRIIKLLCLSIFKFNTALTFDYIFLGA
ncbi:HNH endonuclease [bacterium]|jgi:hypothetical protein|nr:HNH endonuclease [bacterium]